MREEATMKKVSVRRLAFGVCAASLLATAAARAEDFTFTVPVAVRDLPSAVYGGGVRCEVFKHVPPPAPGDPGARSPSTGAQSFALSHGAFQGNVTVRFNATGMALGEAKGYRCWLYYLDASGREVAFTAESPFVGHRAGTPFTPDVRGALNP